MLIFSDRRGGEVRTSDSIPPTNRILLHMARSEFYYY